ncbi:MAG: helix-turn-helix transcriptional regulator [Patescibacteria group bacterium]|jgi:transcriptional regulator with XRE-family HTH domain
MTKAIYLNEYKLIAEKLKKARIESGLTQEVVAEKIKKPQSYISKVEQGEQRIDIIELQHFASLYKKNLNYFIK